MHIWVIAMLAVSFLFNRSVKDYDYVLNQLVGQSAQQLVKKWGKPDRVIEVHDGELIYSYSKTDKTIMGRTRECVSNFEIDDNNMVVNANYYGDDCWSVYDKDLSG